jgi:prepilin-type N-terminal cleavage/methylation domain-containing protein
MITLQKSERWLNKMFELVFRQTNVSCFDNYSERNMYCRKRGFTLIEIIIVIVILAIAAMTALPMLSSASSVQIRSAANLIASDLEYAKSMAISRGQNYSVVFNESGNSYQIEDHTGTIIQHPVKKGFLYEMDFSNDSRLGKVDITNINFDGASFVEFDCLGSPVDLDNVGTITLNADGSTAAISVEPVTGYISISL